MLVSRDLLRKHLGISGDDRQRRIDFMRNAGGQQSDRAELVGLDQAAFQVVAIRDIVEDDQAANLLQIL